MPETPHNAGYLIAAYVVAAVVLVGYAVALLRRGDGGGRRKTEKDGRG